MPQPTTLSLDVLAWDQACQASAVRSTELGYFLKANGLVGAKGAATKSLDTHDLLGGRDDATPAKRLRALLASIRYGASFEERRAVIEAHASGLVLGDLAFIHETIAKRDAMIANFIGKHGGPEAIETLELSPVELTLTGKSALGVASYLVAAQPNVIVATRNKQGQRHSLVLDYEVGYLAIDAEVSHDNTQKLTLALLEFARGDMDTNASVEVAYLSRNDADAGEMDRSIYRRDFLLAELPRLLEAAENQHILRAAYDRQRDAAGDPAPEFSQKLDEIATPGEHCIRCAGKVCCGRIREAAQEFKNMRVTSDAPVIARARALVNADKDTIENPKSDNTPLNMNTKTLATFLTIVQDVTDAARPFEAARKDGEELVRQLAAAKKPALPGFALKEGARQFKVREQMPVGPAAAGAGNGEQAVSAVATDPKEIFRRLKVSLPAFSAVTEEQCIRETAAVDPTALRKFIADRAGVGEKEVFEKVLKPLGDRNPIEMRQNKPSVVRATAAESKEASGLKAVPTTEPVPLPEERTARPGSGRGK
jgi:hypothetical protein